MPTYPYRCPKCDLAFEAYNKVDDRMNQKCATCGGPAEYDYTGLKPGLPPNFSGKELELIQMATPKNKVQEIWEKGGDIARRCLRPDGSVMVRDKSDVNRYERMWKSIRDSV